MEAQEPPLLAEPSSNAPHIIVWRVNGIYNVKAFATYDEAAQVYQAVINAATNQKPIDPSFVVYLVYWLAGYTTDDH
jgi:hypothetical protein